jgi:hypothetical protein
VRPAATDQGSPELVRAIEALEAALIETDNPVGAARAVRRVAARHQLPHLTSRRAFRWRAEQLLEPYFGGDVDVAKAVAWLALDAGWEALGNG